MKKIIQYSICLSLVCLLLLVSTGCNNPTSAVPENRSGVEVSKTAILQIDSSDYSWNNGWYLPKHAVADRDYPFQWYGCIPSGGIAILYYRKQGSGWWTILNANGEGSPGSYRTVRGTLYSLSAGVWEFGVGDIKKRPTEVSASITVFDTTTPSCGSITSSANPAYGNSFEVYANNVQNAIEVWFPTWTLAYGQDDLGWHKGEYDAANNRWKCTIDVSEHKYEGGSYKTIVCLIGEGWKSVVADSLITDVVYDDYSWSNGWYIPKHPIHGRTYLFQWTGFMSKHGVPLYYRTSAGEINYLGSASGVPEGTGFFNGTFNIPTAGPCSFEIRQPWGQIDGATSVTVY